MLARRKHRNVRVRLTNLCHILELCSYIWLTSARGKVVLWWPVGPKIFNSQYGELSHADHHYWNKWEFSMDCPLNQAMKWLNVDTPQIPGNPIESLRKITKTPFQSMTWLPFFSWRGQAKFSRRWPWDARRRGCPWMRISPENIGHVLQSFRMIPRCFGFVLTKFWGNLACIGCTREFTSLQQLTWLIQF